MGGCAGGCTTIELHIRDDKDVRGKIALIHVLVDRRSEDQVEYGLDVGVGNLVMGSRDPQFLTKVLASAQIDQLRMFREGDVLILELTRRTLGEVDRQRVCYFQRRHISVADSHSHTTRTVGHHDGVTTALHRIGEVLPQHFQIGVGAVGITVPMTGRTYSPPV